MNSPITFNLPAISTRQLRAAKAALTTLALHGLAVGLLLANWAVETPSAPKVKTISMQLVTLPAPPVDIPQPVPVAAPEPQVPEVPTPAPQVDPAIVQQLGQAALARKRAEQRELAQERQRLERQREEQARAERQRREQEQQRQAAEQLAAQQRQQAAAAAAEQARLAEAAAAASRQYLPIAKQAPSYPRRALDQGIQGECTVSYTVNAQGRVEAPKVVGDCHPLFIRPSLQAAQSFRYQPRVVDGRAVAVPEVKNTFTYRIE
jgi:periplasmic protein TonB